MKPAHAATLMPAHEKNEGVIATSQTKTNEQVVMWSFSS